MVRQEGKRIRTEFFEVRVAASLLPHPRVGIVVPKYKQSSVDRNRLKRRMRELARTRWLHWLPAGADVVLRVVPAAYEATFERLAEQIGRAGERIQRLVTEHGGTSDPIVIPDSSER